MRDTVEFDAELEANGIPTGFTDAAEAKAFTLAGRAHITLTSLASGHHFTYRVSQAEDRATGEKQNLWFVGVLASGSADEGKFTYLGVITSKGEFKQTAKSKVRADAPSVKAFTFFWRHLAERGVIAPNLRVQHEGRCGRCGRTLTEPLSLARGIGPECFGKLMCVGV